jgi:hypothetical protein
MKILVVNNAGAECRMPATRTSRRFEQILQYVGTPYEVVDVTAAAPTLSDGACHGYFQGVIFAYGGDYYAIQLPGSRR